MTLIVHCGALARIRKFLVVGHLLQERCATITIRGLAHVNQLGLHNSTGLRPSKN